MWLIGLLFIVVGFKLTGFPIISIVFYGVGFMLIIYSVKKSITNLVVSAVKKANQTETAPKKKMLDPLTIKDKYALLVIAGVVLFIIGVYGSDHNNSLGYIITLFSGIALSLVGMWKIKKLDTRTK